LNNWQQQHKGASLKPIETNRKNPIQDDECFLKTPSDYNSVDSEALVDKVAERECVIKLLDVIEKGLYRKNMLLNAIERMNRHQEQSALATTIQREPKETLVEQYSWMFANLEATNEVLEAAVAHMQIMYCNPLDESVTSKATVEKELAREEALNDIDMTSPYTRVGIGAASPWASSLLKLTELGRTICKDGGNEDDDDIQRSPLDARQAYLESRMGRATGFLLAMNEASRLTEPMVQSNHAVPVAMESVSKLCLDRVLVLPEVSDGGSEGLSCALQGRASAMEELREALDGFNAEFTMLHSKTVETQN